MTYFKCQGADIRSRPFVSFFVSHWTMNTTTVVIRNWLFKSPYSEGVDYLSKVTCLINFSSQSLQVTDHNLIVRYPRLIHMYGLITTRIGLKLPLQSSFFHNSKAVVKCTSTISPVFWGISSSSSSSAISGSSSSSSSMMTMMNGPSARKESVAQATRHHSVIDSREDTFIGE